MKDIYVLIYLKGQLRLFDWYCQFTHLNTFPRAPDGAQKLMTI